MNILTFDTSLDTMYITLGEILAEGENKILSKIVHNQGGKYHSAFLIPKIIELLQEKNFTMQNIDAIGVNIGPGSFTGIRACVTVARIIGQMLDIPVVGIPSLEIISKINTTEKNTLCLMDARKNKAYLAIYSPCGEILEEPQAIELENIFEIIEGKDFFIITDDKMQSYLEKSGIQSINYKKQDHDYGVSLSEISFMYLRKKEKSFNWYDIKPLYIQPPPISMPKSSK